MVNCVALLALPQVTGNDGLPVSGSRQVMAALLLVAILGGGLLLVLALLRWATGARRNRFGQYAASRGWSYQPGLARGWESSFTAPPFGVGVSRRARDMISGVYQSLTFVSYEYQYILGGVASNWTNRPGYARYGEMASNRVFANAVVAFPLDWRIPKTEFVPKAVHNTVVVKYVLGEPVGPEGSNDFNDNWLVQSDDPHIAQGLLGPAMVALLMKPGVLGERFFFENGYLVHYSGNPRFEGGIEDMLGRAKAILDAVPAAVREANAHT